MGETRESVWHSAGHVKDSDRRSLRESVDLKELAEKCAKEENIELTKAHWEVLDFLKDYYDTNGTPPSGRILLQALDKAFAQSGGRKVLYRLFPKGPVSQGCRIAGLPVPDHSVDRSFGTSL